MSRDEASRIFRRIHGFGYEDFCEAIGVEESPSWLGKFKFMRHNFSEGFFGLDDQHQEALWNLAEEMENEYTSATT